MLKNINEVFQQVDSSENVGEFHIGGIKPWELIRFKLYSKIARRELGFGESIATNKLNVKKVKFLLSSLIGYLSQYRCEKEIDYLVFTHGRKTKVGSKEVDIIVDPFIEENNTKKIEVVESSISHSFKFGLNMNLTKFKSFIKKKHLKYRLSREEVDFLKRVEASVEEFNISLKGIEKIYINEMVDFRVRYKYYLKIIKKTKPKKIVHVVSYMKKPLIKAAQELQVPTIELQHGLINELHFGYNQINSIYKPNEILMFGQYWIDNSGFISKLYNMRPVNFKYHTDTLNKHINTRKKKKQILFISQGTIGKELFGYAKEIANSLKSYTVIYKLHPGEVSTYQLEYNLTHIPENLKIVCNEIDTLSLQAQSNFQVGVYSTALLEGIYLDCKTFIFDLPGVDHMKDLIDMKKATLITKPINDNFIRLINDPISFKTRKINRKYIYFQ